jgi:uncharacterized hydrophobic protein (TIGR00271 family)
MSRLSALFRYFFNLDADRDNEGNVIASITRNIHFRGANLWTLIFAIIIASVGLNVNSTAVIIGAMLISPLMGPILGVGLGIGISDSALVRRGLKNLTIATVISIATSTLYFYITPLHTANSELLARTTPTIWDVFIAFAGGLAGVVGTTRREKGNVIPGVAIATALMPPLCTVGFGLATGHWYYALGAAYLFFINSVFICVATVLIVRFMGFHKHVFEDEASRRRMMRYIVLVVVVTMAPSIWLAYRIVRKAVFEGAAQSFVRREFKYTGTQVISKSFVFDAKKPRIELLLIGDVLDEAQIDTLRSHLPAYNLKGTDLVIRQGLNAQKQLDLAQLRAGLLDEVFGREDTARVVVAPPGPPPLPDVRAELKALYPQVAAYSLHKVAVIRTDTVKKSDSVILFVAGVSGRLSAADQQRMQRWLSAKFPQDSVQVVYQAVR